MTTKRNPESNPSDLRALRVLRKAQVEIEALVGRLGGPAEETSPTQKDTAAVAWSAGVVIRDLVARLDAMTAASTSSI